MTHAKIDPKKRVFETGLQILPGPGERWKGRGRVHLYRNLEIFGTTYPKLAFFGVFRPDFWV
jgi:hypothetical protein